MDIGFRSTVFKIWNKYKQSGQKSQHDYLKYFVSSVLPGRRNIEELLLK